MKKVYVGIDVHKDENIFGSAKDDRSAPEIIGQCSTDLNRTLTFIRKYMKKHNLTKKQLHFVYEAGPTGFVLARRLIELNFDCIVAAPSKIAKKSGDQVKRRISATPASSPICTGREIWWRFIFRIGGMK